MYVCTNVDNVVKCVLLYYCNYANPEVKIYERLELDMLLEFSKLILCLLN